MLYIISVWNISAFRAVLLKLFFPGDHILKVKPSRPKSIDIIVNSWETKMMRDDPKKISVRDTKKPLENTSATQ